MSQNIGNERVYLKQCELADRWQISERTLEGWRMRGRGPRVTKIGKRVRYSMAEILTYEKAHLESVDRYV